MDQNRKQKKEEGQPGVGRISQTGNPEDEQNKKIRDISHIDKQEGEMDHGETGGNFSSGKQQERDQQRS